MDSTNELTPPKKRGRKPGLTSGPEKTRFTLRIPLELADKLNAYATRHSRTISDVTASLLEYALEAKTPGRKASK